MIDEYDVGPDASQSRIGVVSFASEAKEEFDLDNYTSNESVNQTIDAIKFPSGATNIQE